MASGSSNSCALGEIWVADDGSRSETGKGYWKKQQLLQDKLFIMMAADEGFRVSSDSQIAP